MLLIKKLLGPCRIKIINTWIQCNNTYHETIKTKSVGVKLSIHIYFDIENEN